MADIIAVNKSEPPNTNSGERSALSIRSALQLFSSKEFDWYPPVLLTSGLTGLGFNELDAALDRFQRHSQAKGWFDKKRKDQQAYWFENSIREGVFELLQEDIDWQKRYEKLSKAVAEGSLNEASAYAVLIGSVVASLALKVAMPDLPFVLRIWLVFLIKVALGVVVELVTREPEAGQPVLLSDIQFGSTKGFNVSAIAVPLILVLIYAADW